MGRSLTVALTGDYLTRILKKEPYAALAELIWNSLDADASSVQVVFNRNSLSGIDEIVISDNGSGICFDSVEQTFGRLGGSHKLAERKSTNGRTYHGKLGWGRYRALALGGSVKWTSTYRKTDGSIATFDISSDYQHPSVFDISDERLATIEQTGVIVTICLVGEKISRNLANTELLLKRLNQTFAPYLLAFSDITITVDDIELKPHKMIEEEHSMTIVVEDNEKKSSARLNIILWKCPDIKELWLCASSGAPYKRSNFGVNLGQLSVSAYLCSEYIERLWAEDTIELEDFDPLLTKMLEIAREQVRSVYSRWLSERAAEAVSQLKAEGMYPYKGDPVNSIDAAERQVFDICLVKINEAKPDIFSMAPPAKRLTMTLIREALRDDPGKLRRILEEVFNLSEAELQDFVEVLDKTSLSLIISTSKLITERLQFLNGLEQIMYDPDINKFVKERSQLHKILLHELWVFGDQYTYGADDVTLANVLKEYANHLGRDELVQELFADEIQSMNDIPDICLWHQYSLGRADEVENLVIELKRPTQPIRDEEINQIKRYARIVACSPRFPTHKTRWSFLLLGGRMNDDARFSVRSFNGEPGYVIAPGDTDQNITVKVKEWGQVIHEARARHKFLEERLQNSATNEDGMRYLQQKYIALLPKQAHPK